MTSERQLGRSLRFDIISTAILQLIARLRSVVLLPVISRVGDAALYGAWTQLTGLVALLTPLANLSVQQGVLRFSSSLSATAARRTLVRAWLFCLGAGASCALLTCLVVLGPLRPQAVRFFGVESDLELLIVVTLLQVPFAAAMRVATVHFRARRQLGLSQVLDLLLQVAITIAACGAFLAGRGLVGAQVVVLAVLAIASLVTFSAALKRSDSIEAVSGAVEPSTGGLIAFSWPFVPNAFSDWVLHLSDRYLIALWHPLETVGLYAAAYGLTQAGQLFSYPVEYAVTPRLPRLWDAGAHGEIGILIQRSLVGTSVLIAPTIVGAACVGPTVLRILGSDSMAGAPRVLFAGLAAGMWALASARLLSLVLLVSGRAREVLRLVAACAVVNVVGNLALVPSLAANGAALATLVAYAAYALLTGRAAARVIDSLVPARRLVRIGLAAAIPAPVVAALPFDFAGGFLVAFGYLVAYVATLSLTKAITMSEVRALLPHRGGRGGASAS